MNAPQTIKPGFYAGISNDDYHNGPGLSKSGLDLIERSPYHFHVRQKKPPTPAMEFGTHAHACILEPKRFAVEYVVAPDCDRRTKAGKDEWQDFCLANEGKTIIDAQTHIKLIAMRESVMRLPTFGDDFQRGAAELSAYWMNGRVLCKCRPDMAVHRNSKSAVLYDLKTTKDASAEAFARAVARFRYEVQAAWYSDGYTTASGLEVADFIFVAVETEYPFSAALYRLDANSIASGRDKYRRNLDTYHECVETGEWPGYSTDVQTISLPAWAFDSEEMEIGYV